MEELRSFNLANLYDKLSWTDDVFIEWLQNEYGTHRSVFRSYVSDFVWRRKFKGEDIMYNLWSQIALLYVCE
uniref:Uncharacterized protein n=1 Tax=Ditylenchus dipsaci TaxID=166011 RepID=A0A915EQH2_9BILA